MLINEGNPTTKAYEGKITINKENKNVAFWNKGAVRCHTVAAKTAFEAARDVWRISRSTDWGLTQAQVSSLDLEELEAL